MLDIRALHSQLHEMTDELSRQADVTQGRLAGAVALVERALAEPERLTERIEAYFAQDEQPWLLARPRGGLAATAPLPNVGGPATVVATDGSQITPSHHEIALCYLINIGRIMYTYGTGEPPLQDSRPYLFHKESDMFPRLGKRRYPVTEELIATYRNMHERRALVELAAAAIERGHPVLALVDGSLIQWMLEGMPEAFQNLVLEDHLQALSDFRALGVPVAGYISGSRSADVVNMLKLVACPKATLECPGCAWNEPPCERTHVPLADRRLWERRLTPGERSPVFMSSAPILAKYGAHTVGFFYLHVGAEVARIEVPAWVAEDAGMLERVHALAYDQAQKGMGYPIALQEAHNRAVVSREDRAQFFALLGQQLARAGMPVRMSHKQLKKRMGVV